MRDSGCSNRLCSVIKLFWLNFFCFQTTGNSSSDMLIPDCNLKLVVQVILLKILRKLEVNVVLKITQTFFWLTQSLGSRNRLITVSNYRFISAVRMSGFHAMLCIYSTVSNLCSPLLHLHLMLFLNLLYCELNCSF